MSLNFTLPLILLSVSFLPSCTNAVHSDTAAITADFYHTYSERNDFEKFLSFYHEDIVLEDIINGDSIAGKSALRDFFAWDTPGFVSLDSNNLVVQERIIEDRQAVVKGYFSPFRWGDAEFEAMHFTTILTFTSNGQIIKQVDWINYPATLINYEERNNANDWLK